MFCISPYTPEIAEKSKNAVEKNIISKTAKEPEKYGKQDLWVCQWVWFSSTATRNLVMTSDLLMPVHQSCFSTFTVEITVLSLQ